MFNLFQRGRIEENNYKNEESQENQNEEIEEEDEEEEIVLEDNYIDKEKNSEAITVLAKKYIDKLDEDGYSDENDFNMGVYIIRDEGTKKEYIIFKSNNDMIVQNR